MQLWAFAMWSTNGMSFSPMVILRLKLFACESVFLFAVNTFGKLIVPIIHAAEHNYGAVVSLWLPVILVYFS